MALGGSVDSGSGDPTGTLVILRAVIDRVLKEAAKYSDPTERDYQAGMRRGAYLVLRFMEEIEGD